MLRLMYAWAIVISGLGGGLVGATASLGTMAYQQRRIDRRDAASARGHAYAALLVRSLTLAQRATTLMTTARLRSGLTEGFDVALRHRRPLDPMQLHDWLMQDMLPAIEAWSNIWLTTPPPIVAKANELFAACSGVMEAATMHPRRSGVAKLREYLLGVQEDSDQAARLSQAARGLSEVRRDFALLVRDTTAQEPAELFVGGEPTEFEPSPVQ
jgi:hypothetical protein